MSPNRFALWRDMLWGHYRGEQDIWGNEEFLRSRGVEVIIADDPDCTALMERFIREKPELWAEDIAEDRGKSGRTARTSCSVTPTEAGAQSFHRRNR